ncbi:MAG: DUF4388 domain-containing protein [Candidatus Brocadiia bacterium]
MPDSSLPELLRIVIVEAESCDCYLPGEQVVVRWPEVVKSTSDKVCARFMAALQPVMEEVLRSSTGRIPGNVYSVRCRAADCRLKIRFEDADTIGKTERLESREVEELVIEMSELPIFARLESDALAQIANNCMVKIFEPGEEIIKRGEKGQSLSIILDGAATVMGKQEDDADHAIAFLGKGDSIGEMSVLTGEPTSATVLAGDECRILEIPQRNFTGVVMKYPSVSLYFTRLLAERLRASNKQILALLDGGVTGKLTTLGLSELIQIIKMNVRSGVLRLTSGGKRAMLYFREGRLLDARYSQKNGEEAFFQIATWQQGDFQFDNVPVQCEPVITTDVMALLLEAMRRSDESAR